MGVVHTVDSQAIPILMCYHSLNPELCKASYMQWQITKNFTWLKQLPSEDTINAVISAAATPMMAAGTAAN